MIAGLEPVTGGTIRMGDRIVNHVPAGKRNVSMVFQNYAIYPHMTVRKNIEYGLKMQIGEGENVTEIRGYFLETGTPGFRETTVRSQMKREMQGISEAAFEAGWVQDPYDPAYRQGLLMTEAEKEQYDARFPLHPLTEARKFAAGMAELN